MKILDDKYRRGKNLAFCLHIPDERQGYVLCYSLYENDELLIFVNRGQKQFHLSSLDIENKKSIGYTDEEINQTAHFAINLIAYISGWSLISIRKRKVRLFLCMRL